VKGGPVNSRVGDRHDNFIKVSRNTVDGDTLLTGVDILIPALMRDHQNWRLGCRRDGLARAERPWETVGSCTLRSLFARTW
jgi:hypothetical protein